LAQYNSNKQSDNITSKNKSKNKQPAEQAKTNYQKVKQFEYFNLKKKSKDSSKKFQQIEQVKFKTGRDFAINY